MKDENARIREQARASQARQILDSPLWQEAWAATVTRLREWMESPSSSEDTVLEARRMLIAAERVRKDLEHTLQTGELATLQLERSKHGYHK